MSENTRQKLSLTGLFAAFMFLQLVVLGLGNRAGEGYLSAERRELVYYALQAFVILGFLAYAAADRLIHRERARRTLLCAVLTAFTAGAAVMLFADKGSLFYLIVTYAAMPCLGCLGGAVYCRMSRATAAGERTARSMGVGCAAAVALQFVLQLQWGVTPILPVFVLAALALLAVLLLRRPPDSRPDAQPQPASEAAAPRRVLFACLIASAFLLFTSFYNGYIHHLQVLSGYTDYNVYSWPRLLLIPCYLVFAAVGEKRQGRLVPIVALCIALAAMLNSVLNGSTEAYWLNMCLFYCAIAASVSYYNLTFWRLAQRTKHPALWASAGRILDSGVVLLGGALHVSELPAAAVLTADVAGLIVIIVLMAVNGDFSLTAAQDGPAKDAPARGAGEDPAEALISRCALTPTEGSVLRELVRTEDTQEAVAARLGMSVNTLRHHVTAIYRKTGAGTRAGLVKLCAARED